MEDDQLFPSDAETQKLETLPARVQKRGVMLINIAYAIAIGVAALWVFNKLFRK